MQCGICKKVRVADKILAWRHRTIPNMYSC
jgi:hypothetical protein